MKKTFAIILALMMVFAFSSMALAVDASSGPIGDGVTDNLTNNGATTVVSIQSNGQISATVPLTVTLVVAANGDVTGPDNYTITNTSVFPIMVTNVDITATGAFTLDPVTETTKTDISGITLTDGQSGAATDIDDAWADVKTAPTWNMAASNGTITLLFDGNVPAFTVNVAEAVAAFNVVFTIAPGAH